MNPFEDPLQAWPNRDLLVDQGDRDKLAKIDERLLSVFDWPELRKAFVHHDILALEGKKIAHYQGVLAVVLTGLGVIILTISIEFVGSIRAMLSQLALGAMLIGGLLAVFHWGGLLRAKRSWLLHRLKCERLRQLHFQSTVGDFNAHQGAYFSDDALVTLRSKRDRWLLEFQDDYSDCNLRLREAINDQIEARCWLRNEWKQPTAALQGSEPVLEALYRQRILVQWSYAQKNLGADVFSASGRDRLASFSIAAFSIAVTCFAGAGLVAALTASKVLGLNLDEWTQVAAVFSAIALTIQTLKQGFQTKSDADRYIWYAEQIDSIRIKFESGSFPEKIDALRQLELASYHELRKFLIAHADAKFLS